MQYSPTYGLIRRFSSTLIGLLILFSFIYAQNGFADAKIKFDGQFDKYVSDKMGESRIPGAVIVIVKDGEILFSRGYGYADLDEKIPIDPAKTLFRVGSISKVITGTAVMQQVDLGLIDIDSDINNYLETFTIPRTFKKPITTAHLLTHTAGFDDRYIGKSARSLDERISLEAYCRTHLPQRFIAPGEIYTYSNYGNALAGYLVEVVSGTSFAEYIEKEILNPLGMHFSGFELSEKLKPHLARGYSDLTGEYRALPYDYLLDAPAGQFVSSGEDMARFMLAHLQEGEFNGFRILTDRAIREMHRQQFTNHPGLQDGVGYTFDIRYINGHRTLSHGGAYAGFYALMSIFPEQNTGIFIAHNILKTEFINKIMRELTDTLFENSTAVPADLSDLIPEQVDAGISRFTGTYRHTRYPRNTFDKLGVLAGAMGGEMKLQKNKEGMLLMPDIFGNERRLIKTAPLLFQSIDDNYTLAFRENEKGNITHAFTSGINSMERIPWYYTVRLHRVLFILFPSFFLTITGIAFTGFLINKLQKTIPVRNNVHLMRIKRIHLWVAGTFCLYILMTIVVIGALVTVDEIVAGFPYGLPDAMYFVQLIPFITIILTIGLLYLVVREWFERNMPVVKRIYYSSYTIVSVSAILFLGYWNLIGFNF